MFQIDVESVERPLYYSSGDEPDIDCLYYLPIAPEIDDPEGEITHSYDNGKTAKTDEEAGNTAINNGPPSKKTKMKNIDINGETYDENAVLTGKILFLFQFL